VANSRHASLIAGWDNDVQDSLVPVALNVIGAFAVLRQARALAFRALENDLNFGVPRSRRHGAWRLDVRSGA